MSQETAQQNTVENFYDNFKDCIEMKDWLTADLVIRDAKDLGYEREADLMAAELHKAKFTKDWITEEQK